MGQNAFPRLKGGNMAIIKTELLNFVIGKADELAAADGRNWATSNYFVMVSLDDIEKSGVFSSNFEWTIYGEF